MEITPKLPTHPLLSVWRHSHKWRLVHDHWHRYTLLNVWWHSHAMLKSVINRPRLPCKIFCWRMMTQACSVCFIVDKFHWFLHEKWQTRDRSGSIMMSWTYGLYINSVITAAEHCKAFTYKNLLLFNCKSYFQGFRSLSHSGENWTLNFLFCFCLLIFSFIKHNSKYRAHIAALYIKWLHY